MKGRLVDQAGAASQKYHWTFDQRPEAYAAEQANMEQQIHKAWSSKWCHAQELTQPIIMAVMRKASLPTNDIETGYMEFKIEEDSRGIENDLDFKE